jgi:Predicted protease
LFSRFLYVHFCRSFIGFFAFLWSRVFYSLAVLCACFFALTGGLSLVQTIPHILLSARSQTLATGGLSHPYALIHAAPFSYLAGRGLQKPLHCQAPGSLIRCYGPAQIRTTYSIQPLIDKGITGKGSSIVIIDAFDAPHLQHDLTLFNRYFSLPDAVLNIFKPDGVPTFDAHDHSQTNWSAETTLDVEWAHAIAPAATLQVVLAKSGSDTDLLHAVQFAVRQNLGDTLSMSFGEDEVCLDANEAPLWHEAFYEAALKGMTLFSASGDNGASSSTCDNERVERAVTTPADDPLVTVVGGTRLDADATTGAYHGEVTWNDPASHSASGGGYSKIMPRPYYQAVLAQPGLTRAVPDVAYDAAQDVGVVIVWSDGEGGADGLYINGGTSVGAPQWAALAALGAQMRGQRLGFLNPALYALGSSPLYPALFHDITSGNNAVTLPDKTHHLMALGGEKAGVGWDATTGWGTPKAETLLPALVDCLNLHSAEYDDRLPSLH